MKNISKFIVAICLAIVFSSNSFAVETKSGVINEVKVFGENNFAFRITFEGYPSMCSLNENWAYIEVGDTNYSTKVSALLAAFSMGNNVTIYTEVSSRNHCHLKDIVSIKK